MVSQAMILYVVPFTQFTVVLVHSRTHTHTPLSRAPASHIHAAPDSVSFSMTG
eukprot:m.10675 g.10675  ORF g.10675 m.10675 type:complete len:53 (+) comp5601_c1_seq1:2407-2565(+)